MPYNFNYLSYEDEPEPEPPIIITPHSNCGALTIVGPEDDDPNE